MAITFPASPTVGQQFQTWIWDGAKWAPAPVASPPNCGYLGLGAASPSPSVKFIPFNGDLIRINGVNYQIPAAGITVPYTACIINGSAPQTIAGNTSYHVFAFIHPTLGMQLDFVPLASPGHVTSTQPGNVGVEIKNGDNTRTLVGIIYTIAGSTPFYDGPQNRLVRSWFNRRPGSLFNVGGGNFNALALQTYVNIACFQNESIVATGTWFGTADTYANVSVLIYLNGGYVGAGGNTSTPGTTAVYENCTAMIGQPMNEGWNQVAVYGSMSAGTSGGSCALSGTIG
jgi:hypothetical protein